MMIKCDYTKDKGTIHEKKHKNCYIEIINVSGKYNVSYGIKVLDNTQVHLVDEIREYGRVAIDLEQATFPQLYADLKAREMFTNAVDYIRLKQEVSDGILEAR